MKKIGVLLRDNDKDYTLKKTIANVILKYDCIPISLVSNHLKEEKEVLDYCDAFILQGGDWYTDTDLEIVKYLYETNKPMLGICLGMQIMGVILGGVLKPIGNNNHQSNEDYVHTITIKKDSQLSKMLKKKTIAVNSRHIHNLTKIDERFISSYSNDNVIESIEDKDKNFFIGIQWHPELIIKDKNSKKILNYFFNIINKNGINK